MWGGMQPINSEEKNNQTDGIILYVDVICATRSSRRKVRERLTKIKILHGSWTLFVYATLLSSTYYSRNCQCTTSQAHEPHPSSSNYNRAFANYPAQNQISPNDPLLL